MEKPLFTIVLGDPERSDTIARIEANHPGRTTLPSYRDAFPGIYASTNPIHPAEYFGGPWLPRSHYEELHNFFVSVRYPLQVLENPSRRKQLVQAFKTALPPKQTQHDFFNDGQEDDIEYLLDQVSERKRKNKALYAIWHKQDKGKSRQLSVPSSPLEKLLTNHVARIIHQAPLHPCSHGGEKGYTAKRSIQSTHLPLGTVFTFDMSRAFQNVHTQYVFDFYYRTLKDIVQDREAATDLAGTLSCLSTVFYKDEKLFALAQGSPISIPLFNRLMFPVDEALEKCCKKRNLRYSRWIDDFTISAPETNRRLDKIAGAISLVGEDFPIALNKVFFQQNVPIFYLLGHKIIGNLVFKATEEETKNRGKPIPRELIATGHEREFDVWSDDPILYDGEEDDLVF